MTNMIISSFTSLPHWLWQAHLPTQHTKRAASIQCLAGHASNELRLDAGGAMSVWKGGRSDVLGRSELPRNVEICKGDSYICGLVKNVMLS